MVLPPAYTGRNCKEGDEWKRGSGDREMSWWALGGGWVGTVWSQGCLPAAAGPGNPRGQGRLCWHLVSAKRIYHPECSISLVTGLEQTRALGSLCAHVGNGRGRGI